MKFNKSTIALVTLCLLASASVSLADEMNSQLTGKELQELCTNYQKPTTQENASEDNMTPAVHCAQYMKGVVETSEFYERMMFTVSGNHIFCFPKKKVSAHQAILVTNDYIKRHPEKLASRGVILVMEAFLETYSCKR